MRPLSLMKVMSCSLLLVGVFHFRTSSLSTWFITAFIVLPYPNAAHAAREMSP